MKKGICLFLSIVLLLSCLPLAIFAEEINEGGEAEETVELTNVAQNESALAYATSEKNTLWTPAGSLIDGKYSKDTWQGWECAYPNIIYGSDTSAGFSGDYFGVKFLNKEYYEIHEIYINLGLHAAMGNQNAKFKVQLLVEGVWVTVKEFSDSDTKPLAYESYEEAMEKDTSFYHIPAEYSFKLDTPLTTNNVRVTISEFGKNYPGGDVLIFPYVYEIELVGKRGITPELELPEGAVISSNIGYQSFPESTSAYPYRYPYCAIDGDITTYWAPRSKKAGESLSLVFTEAKKINKAVLNFGKFQGAGINTSYPFDIEALVDGSWVKVADGVSLSDEVAANLKVDDNIIVELPFDEVETTAIRVAFTEAYTKVPTVYEFEAHMSEEKSYYVEDRYDAYQRSSASKGNIAIIGTPYASRDFIPYSDISYIIDGRIDPDAYVWFTGVVDMPSYCGVTFEKKQLIDRIALFFHVPDQEGVDIMSIQIQAKIDGEYKTLITTKSYDKDMKYAPAFKFDPVETDDIRILYTAGNGTFAHLKELELYSPNGGAPMFNGLSPMMDVPEFKDMTTATEAETESNTQVNESTDTNGGLKELPSEVEGEAENIALIKPVGTQPLPNATENAPSEITDSGNGTAVVASVIVAACVICFAGIAFISIKQKKTK